MYSTKTDPRENFRDTFGAWQLFGNYCKECFHQSKILLVLVLKARISLADIKLCEYEVLSVAMPLASAESCLNLAVRKMSLKYPPSPAPFFTPSFKQFDHDFAAVLFLLCEQV